MLLNYNLIYHLIKRTKLQKENYQLKSTNYPYCTKRSVAFVYTNFTRYEKTNDINKLTSTDAINFNVTGYNFILYFILFLQVSIIFQYTGHISVLKNKYYIISKCLFITFHHISPIHKQHTWMSSKVSTPLAAKKHSTVCHHENR